MRLLILIALCLPATAATAANNSLISELRQLKEIELRRYHAAKHNFDSPENASSNTTLQEVSQVWQEQRLRIDILDRLIFYTDSHYTESHGAQVDSRNFLQQACMKVAERDIEEAPEKSKQIWPFLRNFAQVLNDAKDSDLAGVPLLAAFFEHSTVLNPKEGKSFLEARDYTNGVTYQAARPVSREDLAEISLEANIQVKVPPASPIGKPRLKPVSLLDQSVQPTSSESYQ